jgi:hypothetical protein
MVRNNGDGLFYIPARVKLGYTIDTYDNESLRYSLNSCAVSSAYIGKSLVLTRNMGNAKNIPKAYLSPELLSSRVMLAYGLEN